MVVRDVDVIVVGAGPAGAAAATALAAGGAAVAVLNSRREGRQPIGETVPPEILTPLAALGLDREFRGAGHLADPGTVVSWGGAEPFENDAITNPYGHGWHLDRQRFDQMLVQAAVRAGARLYTAARFANVSRYEHVWHASCEGRVHVRAPMLVDATGRAARFAGRLGGCRRRENKLVGLVRFGSSVTCDPRTFIETCESGWWYAAALPQGRAVTMLMTDADLLPAQPEQRERFWHTSLARTTLVREVMGPDTRGALTAAVAAPSVLEVSADAGWVAVGDAARTLDPLAGQGITAACDSAVDAAAAILAAHRTEALRAVSRRAVVAHRHHVQTADRFYRSESRWRSAPFWARRQQRLR